MGYLRFFRKERAISMHNNSSDFSNSPSTNSILEELTNNFLQSSSKNLIQTETDLYQSLNSEPGSLSSWPLNHTLKGLVLNTTSNKMMNHSPTGLGLLNNSPFSSSIITLPSESKCRQQEASTR